MLKESLYFFIFIILLNLLVYFCFETSKILNKNLISIRFLEEKVYIFFEK